MAPKVIRDSLKIENMTCAHCEMTIERALIGVQGIKSVKASYSAGTVIVDYDPSQIKLNKIRSLIESQHYHVRIEGDLKEKVLNTKELHTRKNDISRYIMKLAGISLIVFAVYNIANSMEIMNVFKKFPIAKEGMGYGMLFVIGLLTSAHCISMCGGICLSQCGRGTDFSTKSRWSAMLPSFKYNIGRVISYTVIGGLVGAMGSVVSFSGQMKGSIQIVAGILMVIMGLNMLNLFPGLRRFTLRMPKVFAEKIYKENDSGNSPLYVGLLNGLMPCGPLQAMQIYALSTGDPVKGAISMFLFSAGTFPLMFGFGAVSSLLNKKFTNKLTKVSAVLVLVMGVFMFNSGMALSGFSGLQLPSEVNKPATEGVTKIEASNVAVIKDGLQMVTTGVYPGGYEPVVVQKGVPLEWTMTAEDGNINECNNGILIPKYNIDQKLAVGDNIVKFTPESSGTITFSCWMGMIRSKIVVVDDLDDLSGVSSGYLTLK